MDHVTIFSVSPTPHAITRSYGSYLLRGVEQGEEYVALRIENATDYERVPQEDDPLHPRMVPVVVRAETIAADILQNERHFITPEKQETANEGIFLCAGEKPTPNEIELARRARVNYLVECVRAGDQIFSRHGVAGVAQIPDFCKRAVEELGERREWVFVPAAAKSQCAGCGAWVEHLRDGSLPAICAKCGAPLDKEKAIALGLWSPPKAEQPEPEPETVPARTRK